MSENINKGKKKKKGKQKVRKRISHQVMPKGMNLEDWQVALRRQVAREERLLVAAVDDKLQPGEYMVNNSIKLCIAGQTASGIIARVLISARHNLAHASTLKH